MEKVKNELLTRREVAVILNIIQTALHWLRVESTAEVWPLFPPAWCLPLMESTPLPTTVMMAKSKVAKQYEVGKMCDFTLFIYQPIPASHLLYPL